MDYFTHELTIDGRTIEIEIPFTMPNMIVIESYAPAPSSVKKKLIVMKDAEEFREEISSLVPKTLDGSPFDNSVKSLIYTLQQHVNEYGQIFPTDLFTYINESIYLIFQVSDQIMGEKMNRDDGGNYFRIMFKFIWENTLPKELKNIIMEVGEHQDPLSYYALRTMLN